MASDLPPYGIQLHRSHHGEDKHNRLPAGNAVHVRAGLPQEGCRAAVDFPPRLQERRLRGYQGLWCFPEGHAPQELPRSDRTGLQRHTPCCWSRRQQASWQSHYSQAHQRAHPARTSVKVSRRLPEARQEKRRAEERSQGEGHQAGPKPAQETASGTTQGPLCQDEEKRATACRTHPLQVYCLMDCTTVQLKGCRKTSHSL